MSGGNSLQPLPDLGQQYFPARGDFMKIHPFTLSEKKTENLAQHRK
jgi:hypothetical protein